MEHWAITTSKARGKHGVGVTDAALQIGAELQIPVIPRQNKGISRFIEEYHLDGLLVEEEEELICHWPDGSHLAFHPGMAVPRIKQLKDGVLEMLSHVANIQPGDHILDCTMGMGTDAIVMAFAAGETGTVIYAVTSYGLQHWSDGGWRMRDAMDRITPVHCNYEDYLTEQTENSFDIVYFDPMFERPVMQSSGIAPLRREANYAPLTETILEQACKVARRCVVVKHRAGTMQAVHFDAVLGGTYSRIAYGVRYTNTERRPMR